MDITRFSETKTGKLVRITDPYNDWAFVPQPIDEDWSFPKSLWPKIASAYQALGKLDGIGQTLPNPELLLRPLQQREALRSSSLEGTYATPEELLLFQIKQRKPLPLNERENAWLEVSNYRDALRDGYNYLMERPFTINTICQLHRWLLTGVRGHNKSPGEVRDTQVCIGSDRRYVPPPAIFLGECLDSLGKNLQTGLSKIDPLIACFVLHYQFEAIHPFKDGNGRVGRVFLSLLIWKWCNLSMPWLYLSAFFERYKNEYIDSMFEISASGNWERYLRLCLDGTIVQAGDSILRCEKLSNLRKYMKRKTAGVGARVSSIIDDLYLAPMLTIPQVAKHFNVTYPTAKSDIDHLLEEGILAKLPGALRPAVFYAPEIFRIAYDDDQV